MILNTITILLTFTSALGATFQNPVIWQDFADVDIIRVNTTYYYSASTMHYSPGAPILRSYDLVHWEWVSHSVPRLDFGPNYDLPPNGDAYVQGVWASFFKYRPSNDRFYWGGCIGFYKTYIYSSPSVEGPWQQLTTIDKCYYDCGLLIDDDDTLYVVYTADGGFHVAQLSNDGKTEVKNQQVFKTPASIHYLEGARFYKRNGTYYIFTDHPDDAQYILRSAHPFGPYEIHQIMDRIKGPMAGPVGLGYPRQGGLVETQTGEWYYMAFIDVYPGGRVPVLAPINWTADGWPQVETVNGGWGQSYASPLPEHPVKALIGVDTFEGNQLGPQYEWNHNPDTTKFSVNKGLHLQTASVTKDLYHARNTLTHRIQGPTSTATVIIDVSAMKEGDYTGLAALRDKSAYIGVKKDQDKYKVMMVNAIDMEYRKWKTINTGKEVASEDFNGTKIHLRCQADIHPGNGHQAHFSYSTDGTSYQPLGPGFTMDTELLFFMAYRFAVFNFATQSLGGSVTVERFEVSTP